MSQVFQLPTLVSNSFGQMRDNVGSWTSQNMFPRELADLFGSGMDDIVGFGVNGAYVALNNGRENFGSPANPPAIASFGTSPSAGGWTSQNEYPRELGQVVPSTYPGLAGGGKGGTGEGIAGFGSDGVYISPAVLVQDLQDFMFTQPAFLSPTLASPNFGASSAAGGWTSQNSYPRFLANVYGSGADDIVGFGSDGVYLAKNLDNGTFGPPTKVLSAFSQAQGWSSEDAYPRTLADVNGDGLADIVGFGANGVYVSLNLGNGQFAAPILASTQFGQSAAAGGWTSDNIFPRELADINGDGRADIVGFGASGVFYALGQPNGTFGPITADIGNFGASAGGWTSQDLYPRLLGDVTGDHKADIVAFGGSGTYVSAAT